MLLSQTIFPRLAIAAAALPFVQFIVYGEVAENGGAKVNEVLHHLKSVVASGALLLGVLLTSWQRMLVFLRLILIPNSLQACAKELVSCRRLPSVCAVRAAPSSNSIFLISNFRTLVFARRHARLKRFPPLLVRRYTPSSDWLKASETAVGRKRCRRVWERVRSHVSLSS